MAASGNAATCECGCSPVRPCSAARASHIKGIVLTSALLEIRVFPWRLRTRVMKARTLRAKVAHMDPTLAADDLSGLVLGLGAWLTIMLAAPVLVLLLGAALFSVELPLLLIIGLGLVVARFAGLIPWTVVIIDRVTGNEQRESTRSFLGAMRRVREINGDRRVVVRWAWS